MKYRCISATCFSGLSSSPENFIRARIPTEIRQVSAATAQAWQGLIAHRRRRGGWGVSVALHQETQIVLCVCMMPHSL